MSMFFTSDTHFGHDKIIPYCDRPFQDVTSMNQYLIDVWNETVGEKDIVYHLGDFAMMPFDDAKSIFFKLNGNIILVRGNHDRSLARMSEMGFMSVCEEAVYQRIRMRHIPFKLNHNEYGLCGHVHKKFVRCGNLVNVGVDRWNLRPVKYKDLFTRKQDQMKLDPEDMQAWRDKK